MEIYADAIADGWFSDETAIEQLATQNRSVFLAFKQWFLKNFFSTQKKLGMKDSKAARKTYRMLLHAQQAAEAKRKSATSNTTSDESSNNSYSISDITTDNGKVLKDVVVLDTNIFKGLKPRDWGKALTRYAYDNLAGQQIVTSDETVIEFARSNERVKKDGAKKSRRVIDKLARKTDRNSQLATAHSKEIIEVMYQSESNTENSHQWLDANGWEYYKVTLAQINGDIYEATINVAKTKDGRNILYDINQIKRIGHGVVSSKSPKAQRDSHINPNSVGIISNSDENVNKNVSHSAKSLK